MSRILLVSHELSVTGAPNSLLRHAKYMREAGHDVHVWTYRDGPLRSRYEEAGFALRVVRDSRAEIKAAADLAEPYDFILCNTVRSYRAADVLQRRGTPCVWFVRETLVLDEDYWMNPDFARVFRNFGNLYTVSDYNAEVVRTYNPNVRVICNAVPDVFRGFSAPSDHVRFGYIGSYIASKGVDLLLDAFTRLRSGRSSAELVLAGEPWTDWGRALRAKFSDAPGVSWLGEVQGEAKERFFDSVDVLCVPSLDEPSGLVVLEGAMHGKAVITTDRTGAAYAVDDSCGRVVEAGSVEALVAAMEALSDAMEVSGMGRRARESYLRCATPELERAAVLKMLDDNLGRPPVVKGAVGRDSTPFFHETRSMTGRRRFYLGGLKVFSVMGTGVRKHGKEPWHGGHRFKDS